MPVPPPEVVDLREAGLPPPVLPPSGLMSPRGRARVIAAILGVLLLTAALVIVLDDRAVLRDSWNAARAAPWWMFALLVALTLASGFMSATVLFLLTRRQPSRAVPPWGVLALLTGVSMPLAVLPLRPGLVGRVLFLQQAYGVSIASSVIVTLQSMILSVVLGAALALAAWMGQTLGVIVVVAIGFALARPHWRREPPSPGRDFRWAVFIRLMEVLVWACRYALVFAIIGRPISMPTSVLLAAGAQVVALSPITLGLREWMTALLSVTTPIGLTADLFLRAVELLIGLPVGGLCAVILWRRARRDADPATAPVARVWRRGSRPGSE